MEVMEKCGTAHIGGAFSSMDILTVLYNKILKINPKNPDYAERDYFILSAGHKGLALYVVLQSVGYFDEEILWTYNKLNTKIPTHPDSHLLPGIEFSLGSLGHGLSIAGGIALSLKKMKRKNRVFVLLGDGETNEGSVWEAAASAVKYELENLTMIVDVNGLQAEGSTEEVMPLDPLNEKFSSFGWAVKNIDGHSIVEIFNALTDIPIKKSKPSCILAKTIKCKGIQFAESKIEFHNWGPTKEESEKAAECLFVCRDKELSKIG